jgi:tetratricopeptide (TPR) repeat protein
VPEKGRFVITENTRGADPANSEIASPGAPAAGSKKDLENQFKMAVFQHRNGDILKAYQGYEYVLGYDPYNLEAHNNLGLIFQEIGKYEDALREFGKVLAIDPKNVQAINNSGVTYFKMQDYTAAVRKFEAALEIDPNNSESYANLGLVYVQLDRVADAKAVFLKVLAMNPRHAETHYNLANLYEKNGQFKDAIFYYQKFLSYSAGTYGSIVRETEKHVDELYQKVQADGTPGGAKSPSVSGQAPPSKIPL